MALDRVREELSSLTPEWQCAEAPNHGSGRSRYHRPKLYSKSSRPVCSIRAGR